MPNKPMLAYKLTQSDLDQLRYPLLSSPKMDGIRAIVQGGKLLTRSLKAIPNVYTRKLFEVPELEQLDGELIVGVPNAADCYLKTVAGVMSRKGEPDVTFRVFDIIPNHTPVTGFEHRSKWVARTAVLKARQKPFTANLRVQYVEHTLIRNREQLDYHLERTLRAGYEGIMLRSLDGVYKFGRSTFKEHGLMAIKPYEDAEAIIIGTYEQEANTNAQKVTELGTMKRSSHKAGKVGKSTLGGFVCLRLPEFVHGGRSIPGTAVIRSLQKEIAQHGMKADSRLFKIGTGTGLTAALREELWAERDSLPGKLIKYKHQVIGAKDKPRQPIFLGFRDPRDL